MTKICPMCRINPVWVLKSGKNIGRQEGYCQECNKKNCAEWYRNNRISKISKVQNHQKSTNYSSEKTEKQRRIRSIKRQTRKKYPLLGKKCKHCANHATEHHHTTDPITIDDFEYCCHSCHMEKEEGCRKNKLDIKDFKKTTKTEKNINV